MLCHTILRKKSNGERPTIHVILFMWPRSEPMATCSSFKNILRNWMQIGISCVGLAFQRHWQHPWGFDHCHGLSGSDELSQLASRQDMYLTTPIAVTVRLFSKFQSRNSQNLNISIQKSQSVKLFTYCNGNRNGLPARDKASGMFY